ncbi:MAG: threonine/serine ThrE exporter family protein [Lachnospiraceae bacterium]
MSESAAEAAASGNAGEPTALHAGLSAKASLIGRVGFMLLEAGSGAWRVRDEMNRTAEAMNVVVSADVGLLNLNYTCFGDGESVTYCLSMKASGINTYKLMLLSRFVREFCEEADQKTVGEFHEMLDKIEHSRLFYKAWNQGLAAGIACFAFTFLLGGGLVEMICAFIGAGLGNFVRVKLIQHKFALALNVAVGVATACFSYVGAVRLTEYFGSVTDAHEAGYLCSMLFIIPGFLLITGGIDFAKQDYRSGSERILNGILIILVATLTGMASSLILDFRPNELQTPEMNENVRLLLRLIMSFIGVYGFSLMYNSPRRMAATAGLIGMISNTLRLEMMSRWGVIYFLAAFVGAFVSGILASLVKIKTGYPRLSLTVPSIVIMVPGMYMYRAMYYLGISDFTTGNEWLVRAVLLVISLPIGLVLSRMVMEYKFRHCT